MHRVDVDRQVQIGKPGEEFRSEERAAGRSLERAQVGAVLFGEGEGLDHFGQLVHAAGHRVAAVEGVLAEVHMEARLLVALVGQPVALGHRQLVEIGVHREIKCH